MKINLMKFLKIVLVLFFLLNMYPTTLWAAGGSSGGSGSSSTSMDFGKADAWLKKGKGKQGISDSNLKEIGSNFTSIVKVLVYIGAGVLVAGVGYVGIMYMVSGPDKRGKLKQQLIGLLVAGIVIFGAYSIWSILIQILSSTIDG